MNQPIRVEKIDRDQVLNFLLKWFAKRGVVTEKFQQTAPINYLELGLIDSMGLMELIAELERAYQIRFDESNFQDTRFVTIQGLAELIADLHGKR